jgi:hypothetical protein
MFAETLEPAPQCQIAQRAQCIVHGLTFSITGYISRYICPILDLMQLANLPSCGG